MGEILSVENVSEPIRPRIARASIRFGARKKIQVKQTNCAVRNAFAGLVHQWLETADLPRQVCHALVAASAAPCNRPQMAKFQVKPCHRPPRNMVSVRLKKVKIFSLDRRPGREKYR